MTDTAADDPLGVLVRLYRDAVLAAVDKPSERSDQRLADVVTSLGRYDAEDVAIAALRLVVRAVRDLADARGHRPDRVARDLTRAVTERPSA